MALQGIDTHLAALAFVQQFYKNKIIEPLLIIAIAAQAYVGGRLLLQRMKWPKKNIWVWTQILSGGYLLMFLILHTSAALITQYFVGLDTNFYWAAGTVNTPPILYGFMPYYFLAVFSLFTHIAAALYLKGSHGGKTLAPYIVALGFAIAIIIVAIFAGVFYEIELPQKYIDFFTI